MSLNRILEEGTVELNEPDEFSGYWYGNHFWVKRVSDEVWYIQVREPSGCYAYDGYWRPERTVDLAKAVDEAFDGAMLSRDYD